MKSGLFYRILVTALVCNVITAITNSRDKDVLNLNGIQDGSERDKVSDKDKYRDGVGTETQEKRSFFKPDVDRRGSYYPSGHGSTGFGVGSGINVGGTGYGPNYHTSGNGYSYGYGAPTVGYPPVLYGGSYPGSSGGGYGLSGGGHSIGGGSYIPAGHSGGGFNKALALKGLLIPIAGVALLGAAAALAKSHPVLLQLGVVSGKKKRSVISENMYPANPYVQPEYRKI